MTVIGSIYTHYNDVISARHNSQLVFSL